MAALVASSIGCADAQTARFLASSPSGIHSPDQVAETFMVTIRGSLFEEGKTLQAHLNQLSAAQEITGKGEYRVKITLYQHLKNYGYTYRLFLCDDSGKVLSFINLGSHSTGTFTRYGIQVTISALGAAS
jgi:hypothetical protein